jgi:hypothetical protein
MPTTDRIQIALERCTLLLGAWGLVFRQHLDEITVIGDYNCRVEKRKMQRASYTESVTAETPSIFLSQLCLYGAEIVRR